MATISAGSIIRGDVVKLDGINNGTNGVVESVKKNGSTVAVKIRCKKSGQMYSYNLPYNSRFETVVTITR